MSTGTVLLVAVGRVAAIAKSAATGAAVGLPGIYFGAMLFGGTGALAGQLLAEASVLVVQLVAARRRLRELRRTGRWAIAPSTSPHPGPSPVPDPVPDPVTGREGDPV
jgi:hypothetical protein